MHSFKSYEAIYTGITIRHFSRAAFYGALLWQRFPPFLPFSQSKILPLLKVFYLESGCLISSDVFPIWLHFSFKNSFPTFIFILGVIFLPPILFLFLSFFFLSIAFPFLFYQTILYRSLYATDLEIMNDTFLAFTLSCGEILLLPLFFSNFWSMWEFYSSKKWKRNYHIYYIFGNKRSSFLKIAKRRKRIMNTLKREESFRKGNHFLEKIKGKFLFLFKYDLCTFQTTCDPRKLHQKSTWT